MDTLHLNLNGQIFLFLSFITRILMNKALRMSIIYEGKFIIVKGVILGMSFTHHGTSIALSNAFNWLTPVLVSRPVSIVSIEC